MRPFTLVLLCLLALTAPAGAVDYYTSAPCSNCDALHSCTDARNSATPKQTIRGGLDCLAPGDTLYLRAGQYIESLTDGTIPGGTSWESPITITAFPGESHTWEPPCTPDVGNENPCRMAIWLRSPNERYIIFDSIVWSGANYTKGGATFSGDTQNDSTNPAHIRFVNCEVKEFLNVVNFQRMSDVEWHGGSVHHNHIIPGDTRGLASPGFYVFGVNNVLFDGVHLHHLSGYPYQIYSGGVAHSTNITIRNNTIHDSGWDYGDCAMTIGDVDGVQVYNNVIYRMGSFAMGQGCGMAIGHAGAGPTNVQVYHNTVTGSAGSGPAGFAAMFVQAGSGIVIRNNILWDNNGPSFLHYGGSYTMDHNLEDVNPLFQSAATDDYHLSPGSPAQGVGLFLGPPYHLDAEGHPFPNPPDAGPYAFGTAFSPIVGTFYVSTTGSDGNDCTAAQSPSTPLATLAKALSCAAGGSTIRLRGGVYAQSIQTSLTPIAAGSSFSAPTTIMSEPGETAILQPTSAGAIIGLDNASTDQYLVFHRLVLDGVNAPSSTGFQVNAGAQHIRFQQGEIRRVANNAVFLSGQTTEVLQNQLHDNTSAGALIAGSGAGNVVQGNTIYGGVSAGVFLFGGATNNVIDGNIIRDNTNRGVRTVGGSSNKVFNNVIASNGGDGIVVESGETGLTVYHNTVWSNSAFGLNILGGAASTAYTNNIFYQNGTDIPSDAGMGTIPTTNVSGDPSFIAPGPPDNFHVAGANVVHAGTTLVAVTTDLAGKGRSDPPGYTIGAYQDDATGLPTVSLTATPPSITIGDSSTLNWTSSNVTSCNAPWTGSTATAGSQNVSPTTTTTYTITCTDGTTPVTSNATVTVVGTPSVSLTATPPSITIGDSSTLNWTSSNVTSCSAPWTASTATAGAQSVAPTTTTTYTITCTDGTTPVTNNATVTVMPLPGPGVRGLPYASSGFFVMP